MKNLLLLALLAMFFTTSCSQCYECSHPVEIEVNGVVTEQIVTEDFCTASPAELEQKENEGFDCKSSV